MRSDIIKIISGILLVFGIIFVYTLEIARFQNTLDFQKLSISSLLAGALLGGLLGYFLGKDRQEILERFQLFMGLVVLSILLMPLLLSWTNRNFAYRTPHTEHLELLRIENYSGSRFGLQRELKETPDGYRVFLLRNQEVLRLQYPTYPFPGKEKGDQVPITISRGFWGFEFVDW